uniref:NADH-ubiquinone oxidoreductase chain 2 n=1 Tax=Haemaphysalis flava TaxID=181088 RepID=Q76LR2_HAEFA|nr:NADH dehydrogenase subunit 2 [Haemaphysalis flava]UNO53819.1 NADH dehydrogenase subunit 2 [Haemaphysalis flava]UXX50237.1 NADH dehydrogenase subunit 2 [Haemaphysalis flava]BAD03983.1 NADH dehydrogenase 2 [Haemaphysalis flava]
MFFKNLMKWMIMITILISISSNHWFIYWIMMEMNMMMFIPIMKYNKLENCNSMISYFIVQSFSSILFFMSASMIHMNYSYFMEILINISVLIKLGMIPFHFWLISISEVLDYNSFLLILTIQKIIPLFILFKMKTEISLFISILSLMMSSIMIFNLKMLKKILIFSSISHLSWMIILMFILSNFWISYMIIYFLMINSIVNFLKKNMIMSLNGLTSNKISVNEKISIIISMMSLGGMPPLLGFVIKFIAITLIIKYSMILMMILIMSSLINIFIYIRMIMPVLLTFNKTNFSFNFLKVKINSFFKLLILLTLFLVNLSF